MWIDTHCHLDASEFGGNSLGVADNAAQNEVSAIVIPAVSPANFFTVAELARQRSSCFYALGIHPICVPAAVEADLDTMRTAITAALENPQAHPRFIGIGEIGLDFFLPELTTVPMREKQEHFYTEQLKMARDFDLPVLLHVRRSQDIILKYLRRIKVAGGIAHAFNGSDQQAQTFIDLGFKLGFGGAMTFSRALQIRRLATQLPLEALVLETDSPDISPSWLHPATNTPAEIPRIGAILAELRGLTVEQVARQTTANAHRILPRLLSA
ncbi:TatD family hydrolase [Undibacterium sp. TJN25]|uniref:TatD family hydrolase n=1 Tax=Undibacterium sp. TJN25 TaxID=3413056 RepID=UPI003BF14B5D